MLKPNRAKITSNATIPANERKGYPKTKILIVEMRIPYDAKWLMIVPSNSHEKPFKTRETTIVKELE